MSFRQGPVTSRPVGMVRHPNLPAGDCPWRHFAMCHVPSAMCHLPSRLPRRSPERRRGSRAVAPSEGGSSLMCIHAHPHLSVASGGQGSALDPAGLATLHRPPFFRLGTHAVPRPLRQRASPLDSRVAFSASPQAGPATISGRGSALDPPGLAAQDTPFLLPYYRFQIPHCVRFRGNGVTRGKICLLTCCLDLSPSSP
jgi:hypothetical protein